MNIVRRTWVPALLLIAFALRMLNLVGESLWRDEVDIVRFAQMPLQNLLQNFPRAGFNGPLYLLLMRGWFTLVGVSDLSLRYFSLLFGMLLIALVYVLAQRLFGRSSASVATLLMTFSPVHIWYAGEGKMYTLQPALLVLALYALLRALRGNSLARSRPWWLVLLVSCSAAFYVQLLSPLVLLVMTAWVGMHGAIARHNLRPILISAGLLILPYLPLLAWQLPSLLNGGSSGHAFVPLDTLLLALFSDWAIGFGSIHRSSLCCNRSRYERLLLAYSFYWRWVVCWVNWPAPHAPLSWPRHGYCCLSWRFFSYRCAYPSFNRVISCGALRRFTS